MHIIAINEAGLSNQHVHDNHVAIGIDFGTTNSLIAIVQTQLTQEKSKRNNKIDESLITFQSQDKFQHVLRIIKDLHGRELIPSIITFQDDNFIIGNRSEIIGSIYSIKRLFGKNLKDVLNNKVLFSMAEKFIDLNSQVLKLNFAGKSMTIPEIASKIFLYLKQQVERDLAIQVTKAVITVPAHFNDTARGEVMLAAKLAGFDVLRLIAEPTSAAYAYGLHKKNAGCYLVYDLGGGTFDVSIVNMQEGVLQVIATGGDNMLGGDDIDHLIMQYLCNQYQLSETKELLALAKQMKEVFSSLNIEIFEQLILSLVERTINITKDTLMNAGNPDIAGIILVGGSTRITLITKMLKESFNVPILADIDPDKTVVWGAALQAKNLTSTHVNSLLIDVVPLSLGLELYGGIVEKIILRNSPMPVSVTKEFTTYVDNQTSIQFHIVQGEREMVSDCRSLARFELNNLPLMKAGAVRTEVTFSIDVDGILSVSVLEKNSGRSQIIEIKPTYGLDTEYIAKTLENAYINAADDYNTRLLQEVIIETKSLIYNVENAMNEVPQLLPKDEMKKIQQAIIVLKNTIVAKNRDLIIFHRQNFESIIEHFMTTRLNYTVNSLLKGQHINHN